jgi:hypothetical protein
LSGAAGGAFAAEPEELLQGLVPQHERMERERIGARRRRVLARPERLLEGEEAISRPFRFELELASPQLDIDAAKLLRTPAAISLLTALLGLESALAITFAIAVSAVAGSLYGDGTVGMQFIAAASLVFGITAYLTARAVWRLRAGGYALAAMRLGVVAVSVALACLGGGFEPPLLAALGLAAGTFVFLSLPSVRSALNQG